MIKFVEEYDSLGWTVIPIRCDDKIPTIKSWSSIKSNEETIDYFEDDSNLGVLMGKTSGVICLDIDVKSNGYDTLADLETKLGMLPDTVQSETPSGGLHIYFKYDPRIKNRINIGTGIDVQSDGTQTLEYPSNIQGNMYEWLRSPFEEEVAELPQAWLNLLSGKQDDGSLALVTSFEAPEEVKEGGRNNTIAQFVGSMLGKKVKKSTIIRQTMKYNKEHCEPPLDIEEVTAVVESMIRTDTSKKKNIVTEVIKEEVAPEWLAFDETGNITIKEKEFATWYVNKNMIYCVNGRFYNKNGVINETFLKNDIHLIIGDIVVTKLATKVKDLLEVIKNEAYTKVDLPPKHKIQFRNKAFDLHDGVLNECDEYFTLHQIPHNYNDEADCPTWRKFVNDLFYEEDLPVVQEYLGYCLLPNTLAQTSMFIIGDGGEGKSRITIMLEHILGENSVVIGSFKGLQDKFSLTSLENQMLFIDDDLSGDALDDTANFKKIVTAETQIEVEPKGSPKYKTNIYSKILCCGNTAVAAKFDRSDGFYRRLLVCKVKPKPDRVPDRELSDKLKKEAQGIINWLLEGALRVVNNKYNIKPSKLMNEQINELRESNDTIGNFLRDTQYIELTGDMKDGVSTKDLYAAYLKYCEDNSFVPLSQSTFGKTVRRHYKDVLMRKDNPSGNIDEIIAIARCSINGKQIRGLVGLKLTSNTTSYTINLK